VLPTTVERVPQHTAEEVNERIRRQTEENVQQYGSAGQGRGQVHIFGLAVARQTRLVAEKWTSPQSKCERLPHGFVGVRLRLHETLS